MLAYLFWHCPRPAVSRDAYEQALLELHRSLASTGLETASFRLEQLPFAARPGYEDWYLVEDWAAIGSLGATAISGVHAARHDAIAKLSGDGWAGVYALLRGAPRAPAGVRWVRTPRGERVELLLEREHAQSAWRRQLVLGPAAEICLAAEPSAGRARLWPD
jgi:hypothetical protein